MYENSVTYQFIANAANTVANGANVSGLPEGAVAIVNEAHNVVTGVAAGTNKVKVANRVNGSLKFSPTFVLGELIANERISYSAPVEQVTYLGFNGTTGSMDTTIDATYTASVRLDNTQGVYNNTPIIKTVPVYLPNDTDLEDTTAGQLEHATRLIDSFAAQFSPARLGGSVIKAERINSGANTAVPTGVAEVTFTNGSTVISATDIGNATTTTILAVGELLRVGVAATSPVYKIVSIDAAANTAVLDRPFLGDTVTLEDDEIQRVTVADQANTDYGVKLTGDTPDTFDSVTDSFPRVISFQVSYTKTYTDPFNYNRKVNGPADVLVTYTTAAFEGVGSAAEIGKREVYATMNEGNVVVSHYPPTRYSRAVNSAATYNQQVLAGIHDKFADVAVGIRPVSKFNIVIAVNDDLTTDWANLDTVLP